MVRTYTPHSTQKIYRLHAHTIYTPNISPIVHFKYTLQMLRSQTEIRHHPSPSSAIAAAQVAEDEKRKKYFEWISFRDFTLYSFAFSFFFSFRFLTLVLLPYAKMWKEKKITFFIFLFRSAYVTFVLPDSAFQVLHKSLNFQHNRSSVRVD